jgi:shikimate kinase
MIPIFRTSQPGSAADPSRPHVILVGLPGSGKTTVGMAVAANLDRRFLDFDQEIERREGRSVGEIFAEKGEPYFRDKERQLTDELREFGNMILAPGGGWAADPDSVSMLRPPGQLVYLRVRPDTAIKRLGANRSTRPLLMRPDPTAELRRLLVARKSAYEAADLTIDTDLHNLQRVIEMVTALASGRT